MNPLYASSTVQTKFADLVDCRALMLEAEKELGAFVDVVTSTFGSQEAEYATERWIQILECDVAFVHTSTPRFRNITVQAAISLASRWINQPSLSRHGQSHYFDTEFSTRAYPLVRLLQ